MTPREFDFGTTVVKPKLSRQCALILELFKRQTEAGTEHWSVDVECPKCEWTLETGGWCGDYGPTEDNLATVKDAMLAERRKEEG